MDVVVITPPLGEEHKDGVLEDIEAAPAAGDVPVVLTRSAAPHEDPNGLTGMCPGPRPLEDLRRAVEAALAPVTQAPAEGGG